MICLVCHGAARGPLCPPCTASLRPAPERLLPGGVRVVAAFVHEGAARELVHLLKYRGVTHLAEAAADAVVGRLPALPLVPVPRVLTRRIRYGVDPAAAFASALARRLRVPVWRSLGAPLHAPRRAGRNLRGAVPSYRLQRPPGTQVMVVDDVLTTGATLLAAISALPPGTVRLGVVANSATVSSLSDVKLPGHRDAT